MDPYFSGNSIVAGLVEIGGLEVACYCRPAYAGAVGGDVYHVTKEEKLMIVLLDVAGHGEAVSGVARVLAETIHSRPMVGLKELMASLDDRIFTLFPDPLIYATGVAAVYDAGVVRFAAAAHPPVLHFRHDGESAAIDTGAGGPLGLEESGDVEEIELRVANGDLVVFHTDGLFDLLGCPAAGAASALSALMSGSASAALCLDAVSRAAGRPRADDMTLIALGRG